MQYNDYYDKFDAKSFELLAKEYAQKYSKSSSVLGLKCGDILDDFSKFIACYEEFLSLLFALGSHDFDKNHSEKSAKNIAGKMQVNALTRDFCKLYFDIKKQYFFSPFCSKLEGKNELKNALIISLKRLLLSPYFSLEKSQKSRLIDYSFLTIKYLILGYFD